jgi:hypothetical protein
MVLLQVVRPFADMRQGRFAVVFVDCEGRHEKDTALRHHVEQLRLFVEVAAMLY